MPALALSCGRGTPMTPVEATKICSGGQARASAVVCVTSAVAAAPRAPVNALLLPALTTSARAWPWGRCGAAQFDLGRGAARAGGEARDAGAGREFGEREIGALPRLVARARGGEADAGDFGHGGEVGRGEGRAGHPALVWPMLRVDQTATPAPKKSRSFDQDVRLEYERGLGEGGPIRLRAGVEAGAGWSGSERATPNRALRRRWAPRTSPSSISSRFDLASPCRRRSKAQ